MSLEGIILGLLAIGIGAAWAFYGLKLFVILLPIWAFFFGLIAGAQWAASLFGSDAGLFATTLSWIIGIIVGLVLAAISYFWYYAAIVILGGAVGYAIGVGAFELIGWDSGIIPLIVGLILGAIFAVGTLLLGVPALLVVVFSAFTGAAAAVNGLYILLGTIKPAQLDEGIFGSLLHQGAVPTILWLLVAAGGIVYQLRGITDMMAAARIERTSYRY
jgi:hypothetical protein